jgi:hypothetical protein
MFRCRELAAFSSLILLLSCGGQEQQALGTFFDAVQSGDNTALAAVSAVEMPVKVQSWEIIEIGEESTRPFALPELLTKAREAKRECDYHAEKMGIWIADHKANHERYMNRKNHDPDAEFTGPLAEHHEEWQVLCQKEQELQETFKSANRDVELERAAAGISLMGAAVNEFLDGDVAIKEALVKVDTGSGEKEYRFTLKNYNLFNTKNQIQQRSRWTITDISEA